MLIIPIGRLKAALVKHYKRYEWTRQSWTICQAKYFLERTLIKPLLYCRHKLDIIMRIPRQMCDQHLSIQIYSKNKKPSWWELNVEPVLGCLRLASLATTKCTWLFENIFVVLRFLLYMVWSVKKHPTLRKAVCLSHLSKITGFRENVLSTLVCAMWVRRKIKLFSAFLDWIWI